MNMKLVFALAWMAAAAAPGIASADVVLDTGTPTSTALPAVLDGNDYYAAEFSVSSTESITSVEAYLIAGMDSPNDTFTMALYGSDLLTNRYSSQIYAGQASYQSDGFNGLSGLNWTVGPGTYWIALEVGAADSAIGLGLPTPTTGGTAPALDFAYNSGSGYSDVGAIPFSVQVTATPVPLPAAIWLLGGGLLGLSSRVRRPGATRA
jgi:hypothetical protein